MGEPLAIETEGAESRADSVGRPWGPWATVGLGVLLVVVWTVAQVVAVVPVAAVRLIATGVKTTYADKGWLFAWMVILGAPVAVGATAFLVRLRKGPSVATYLGLTWPRLAQAIRWFLALLGLIAAIHLLSWARGKPFMPEDMIATYQKAGWPLLVPALVLAAPLAEEFIFRGFILPGLLGSRLGPAGAIAITALAFASLHIQYDVYGLAAVVACGLLFGVVRWRTGSLWLCVLLHAFMNLVATVEIVFFV